MNNSYIKSPQGLISREMLAKSLSSSYIRSDPPSPTKLHLLESSNQTPSKQKYMPSRFGASDLLLHSSLQQSKVSVLNELETRVKIIDDELSAVPPEQIPGKIKKVKQLEPIKARNAIVSEIKKKPIKKAEVDFMMYKEIFVQPREHILTELRGQEPAHLRIQKMEAEKISTINKGDVITRLTIETPKSDVNILKGLATANSTPVLPKIDGLRSPGANIQSVKFFKSPEERALVQDLSKLNILTEEIEEVVKFDKKSIPKERKFFEQQLQVQPPNAPNYHSGSTLAPGNGYAPSIPAINKMDQSKESVKDLIVKSKAGMQIGDAQKEAHIAYYLGMMHEAQKEYSQAIRSYKKFMTCAQNLEDKIGVALALNRIGVNYFNMAKFDKSKEFHYQSLQLIDRENSFAAFYNLGISCRSLGQYEESLRHLKSALDWTREYKDMQSQCLIYGQMGVTLADQKQFENALENLTECHSLCHRIGNTKLQLDVLIYMSKLTKELSKDDPTRVPQTQNILNRAYESAVNLNEKKIANICLCNLGVINGERDLAKHADTFSFGDYTDSQ